VAGHIGKVQRMNAITEYLVELARQDVDNEDDEAVSLAHLAELEAKFPQATTDDILAAYEESTLFHCRMARLQQQLVEGLHSMVLDESMKYRRR
jgi:hypothetical protein